MSIEINDKKLSKMYIGIPTTDATKIQMSNTDSNTVAEAINDNKDNITQIKQSLNTEITNRETAIAELNTTMNATMGRFLKLAGGAFVNTSSDLTFSTLAEDSANAAYLDGSVYKIKIPKGISKIRLYSTVTISHGLSGADQLSVVKNGTVVEHMYQFSTTASSGNTNYSMFLNCMSSILSVSENDIITVRATSGSSVPQYLIMEAIK